MHKTQQNSRSALSKELAKDRDKRTKEIGKLGEYVARLFLQTRHFDILEKNMRTNRGEIDIVCERDGTIHFVEVKSIQLDIEDFNWVGDGDSSYDPVLGAYDPVFRVSSRKIARIKKSAKYYIQKHNLADREIRFDIIVAYLFHKQRKCTVHYHSNIFV